MAERERAALPPEPLECRQRAEEFLQDPTYGGGPVAAIAWALLGIAGELAVIRRSLSKGR